MVKKLFIRFRTAVALPTDPGARAAVVARRLLVLAMLLTALVLHEADKRWDLSLEQNLLRHERLRLRDAIAVGLFWAGIANLAILSALYFTAPWWSRPGPPLPGPRPAAKMPGWLLAALLAAVVLAGGLRWPLAHGGLWWDEIWTLKNAVMGYHYVDENDPARVQFKQRDWSDTFWRYNKPTNHVSFSVASRACLTVWRAVTGRERDQFDEFVMRLPAFAAGLASVFLIGLLLFEWGYPAAAVTGAFLLALHPTHIRYSCDARGYSMVVLITIGALLSLTAVLRNPTWIAFLLFGLCQFLLLWTFPYAVYLSLLLFVCALAGGLILYSGPTARLFWKRLLIANVLAAICLLQLIGPHLAQVATWGESGWCPGTTDLKEFIPELWSRLLLGLPHRAGLGVESVNYPSVEQLTKDRPWVQLLLFYGIPAMIAWAFFAVLAKDRVTRWIIIPPVAAVPLAIWVSHRNTLLIPRFAIYALVAILALAAIWGELVARFAGTRSASVRSAAAVVLPLLLLTAFGAAVESELRLLCTRSLSPARDVARFFQSKYGDDPQSILRAGYGASGGCPSLYDPWSEELRSAKELQDVCRRSREQAKPLYLFYSNSIVNRYTTPAAFLYLDDPKLFQPIATFAALEDIDYHWMFRYTGAPLPDLDPATVPPDRKWSAKQAD